MLQQGDCLETLLASIEQGGGMACPLPPITWHALGRSRRSLQRTAARLQFLAMAA